MKLTIYTNGKIVVHVRDQFETSYSRVSANQLILCARMNDWSQFTHLWKKKTDESIWKEIEQYCETLHTSARWKVKESFARLATTDEDSSSAEVAKEIPLP